MSPIITIKNIGKKYNINHRRGGYVTLRDVLTNVLKSPLKFLKQKAKNIIGADTKEEFWALKDTSFEVKRGEIIGIIGRNGAGKSTLLKILTGITPPTEGEIMLHGKVASLLEIGTGFHPELTGRENIFLNGAILGMVKKEIVKKFDEIVAFAEVERFLDTPVKYYSSGMYVRLAFSVAAHMEPDILLVDEVLAVGDAEFQKKCLGKMEEVTKQSGRTILFVSHNMSAIEKLCHRCVLLKEGKVLKIGDTKSVIDYYLNSEKNFNSSIEFPKKNNENGQITKISFLDKDSKPNAQIPVSEPFSIEVGYEIYRPLEKKLVFFYFYSGGDLLLLSSEGDKKGEYRNYEAGKYKTSIKIPPFLFQVGNLSVDVIIRNLAEGRGSVDAVRNINFEITNKNNPRYAIYNENYWGKITALLDYKTEKRS